MDEESVAPGPEQPALTPPPKHEDSERPILGIDTMGNLTLLIPLHKTGEIFARGFVDVARTEIIKWYLVQAQKQRDLATLATKTGFQRFKDSILNTGVHLGRRK